MDYKERKKLILEKLEANLKVAVEYDGYQSGLKPEDYFESMKSADSLSSFNEVARRVKEAGSAESFKKITSQMDVIRKAMSDYAHELALNSEKHSVDLTKIKDQIFQRHTDLFQRKCKNILVVESPDFFVA